MNNPKKRCRLSERQHGLTHRVCPHCNREINIKTYRDHRRLYFNEMSKSWLVAPASCSTMSDDQVSSSGSSIFSESDSSHELSIDESNFTSDLNSTTALALPPSSVAGSAIRCAPSAEGMQIVESFRST